MHFAFPLKEKIMGRGEGRGGEQLKGGGGGAKHSETHTLTAAQTACFSTPNTVALTAAQAAWFSTPNTVALTAAQAAWFSTPNTVALTAAQAACFSTPNTVALTAGCTGSLVQHAKHCGTYGCTGSLVQHAKHPGMHALTAAQAAWFSTPNTPGCTHLRLHRRPVSACQTLWDARTYSCTDGLFQQAKHSPVLHLSPPFLNHCHSIHPIQSVHTLASSPCNEMSSTSNTHSFLEQIFILSPLCSPG